MVTPIKKYLFGTGDPEFASHMIQSAAAYQYGHFGWPPLSLLKHRLAWNVLFMLWHVIVLMAAAGSGLHKDTR